MIHNPECKHPGPHAVECRCALLELTELRQELGQAKHNATREMAEVVRLFTNLTSTQERCNELLEEVRTERARRITAELCQDALAKQLYDRVSAIDACATIAEKYRDSKIALSDEAEQAGMDNDDHNASAWAAGVIAMKIRALR